MLNSLLQFVGQVAANQLLFMTIYTAAVAALGLLLGVVLFRRPDLKDEMQLAADYSEATEALVKKIAVIAAEKFGIKAEKFGLDKLEFAFDVTQEALAKVGIKGRADAVSGQTILRDLRRLAGALFPPKEPKGPADPAA